MYLYLYCHESHSIRAHDQRDSARQLRGRAASRMPTPPRHPQRPLRSPPPRPLLPPPSLPPVPARPRPCPASASDSSSAPCASLPRLGSLLRRRAPPSSASPSCASLLRLAVVRLLLLADGLARLGVHQTLNPNPNPGRGRAGAARARFFRTRAFENPSHKYTQGRFAPHPVAWDGRKNRKKVGRISFGIRIFVAGGPAPRARARGAAAAGEAVYGTRIQIRCFDARIPTEKQFHAALNRRCGAGLVHAYDDVTLTRRWHVCVWENLDGI